MGGSRACALLAVACVALAACGGGSDDAGCADHDGGVTAAYRATAPLGGPPAPGALDAAEDVLCERAEALDLRVEVRRRGADQLELRAESERALTAITRPGQLAFYDWEPNVFGNPNVPLNGIERALRVAARAKPRAEPEDVPSDRGNDSAGDKHYVLDRRGRLASGEDASAYTSEPRTPPPGGRSVKVPRGVLVVKAEPPAGATPNTPSQYFVIEDDRELTGADIRNPEQGFDQQTQEPIVTMEFSDAGRRAFARVTKRIAQRGQETLPAPGQPPENRFQRFMIAVDGQIVSLATIDFLMNPEGIDATSGAQINGIGSIEETRDLARTLRIGPLPVRLERAR